MVSAVMPPSTSSAACEPAPVEQGPDAPDLVGGCGQVRLAAVARVHRHDEHEIDIVEHFLEQRERGGRVERQPGQHAALPHGGEMALHVHRGLGMKGEDVGAGVGELGDVVLRVLHHEVHVERHGR